MINPNKFATALIILIAGLVSLHSVLAAEMDTGDIQNDVMDVTLFRGAANNTWFEVYFNAVPGDGSELVQMESHAVDLRPERDVTLYVEI